LSLPRGVRTGLALALAAGVVSGFSIFINSYAAKEFHSASVFSSMKNTLVGAALLLLFIPSGAPRLRRLTRRQGAALLALGVVGGSVPFILFFEGLSRAGSANAAFIQKTLFLWVGILAVPFLRERLGRAQIGAVGLLLVAQWMIGAPKALRLDTGQTMVLAATLFWAVEVIIAKRILDDAGGQLGATARMSFGAVLLLGYLAYQGDIGSFASLTTLQWEWLLATAGILLVYVSTWYAAMERAPATAVTCILAVGAPITAGLNALVGRPMPSGEQFIGFALVALAAALLIWLPSSPVAVRRREMTREPAD
jgi:drug/metabolite transporter (DMT)-like permease